VKNERSIFRLQCEPRSCASREEHHTQLIEYDVRMRQEEEKYSQLLAELQQTHWLIPSSSCKSNLTKNMEVVASSKLETTRLTDEEILYGCGITMEQVLLKNTKPSVLVNDGCSNRNCTQHSIAFQYTLSMQQRNISNSCFGMNKMTITIT
jgi:hypothetical protein